MCTCKDTLAHSLGVPCLDDIMSFHSLTTYRWTIWKQDHSKSRHFSPNFEWFYTKWKTIVPILNGRVSRFQTTFENWSVPQPAYFLPFKIWTCPDFGSPLYCWIGSNLLWVSNVSKSPPKNQIALDFQILLSCKMLLSFVKKNLLLCLCS